MERRPLPSRMERRVHEHARLTKARGSRPTGSLPQPGTIRSRQRRTAGGGRRCTGKIRNARHLGRTARTSGAPSPAVASGAQSSALPLPRTLRRTGGGRRNRAARVAAFAPVARGKRSPRTFRARCLVACGDGRYSPHGGLSCGRRTAPARRCAAHRRWRIEHIRRGSRSRRIPETGPAVSR